MFYLLFHPILALRIFVLFLGWYLWETPRNILRRYAAYARALREIFSFTFLIRTLFAPWKSITDPYPMKGFHIEKIMETFFLNLTARTIGFLFRIVAMIFGIVAHILCIVTFLTILTLWIGYPAAVFFAVKFMLQH